MRKKSKNITTNKTKQTNNETQSKAVREKKGQNIEKIYRKQLTKWP